jgi:GDP-mannose 6-dehydrogenase
MVKAHNKARLSIFGLGYVGCVSAACLAREGHHVIGVDVNEEKLGAVNAGQSPVLETGLDQLISDAVSQGRLRATSNSVAAVNESDISLICIGTPGNKDGSIDLSHLINVCEQIGSALREKRSGHIVVVRSTVLPGTVGTVLVPILESQSGRKAGRDFGVCVNPEFMREGTSISDFYSPPFTLIGTQDNEVAAAVSELYSGVITPVMVVSLNTAEMIKYACNAFHALKVGFANEIGNLCKELDIDGYEVMEILCRDTKLNLSSKYLRPGFSFGGSCLPKDLRAILYQAEKLSLDVPILSATLRSNRLQIDRALQMILDTGKKRAGLLGLSFKTGTDDLRGSPAIMLVQRLLEHGLEVAVYDPSVSLPRLIGTNKQYLERELPGIAQFIRASVSELLDSAEVVIIINDASEFRAIETNLRENQIVIDLARLFRDRISGGSYQGICW